MTLPAAAKPRHTDDVVVQRVRWVVALFLIIDATSTAQSLLEQGGADPRWRPVVQVALGVLSACFFLWERYHAGFVAAVAANGVLLSSGYFEGTQYWFVAIASTMSVVARRSAPLIIAGATLVTTTAAVALSDAPYALYLPPVAAVFMAFGLVLRALLTRRDAGREAVAAAERENAAIRSHERGRLSQELAHFVGLHLRRARHAIRDAAQSNDSAALAEAVVEVDTDIRRGLAQMRTLVEMLRESGATAEPDEIFSQRRWRSGMTTVIRIASLALLVWLVSFHRQGSSPWTLATTSEVVVFAGAALLPWHRHSGLVALALGLLLSAAPGTAWWVSASAAALLVAGAWLDGRWAVLAGAVAAVAGFAVLVALDNPSHLSLRLIPVLFFPLPALLGVEAARYFLRERRRAQSDLVEAHRARRAIAQAERDHVARELHDVVSHQLTRAHLLALGVDELMPSAELHRALERMDAALTTGYQELQVVVESLDKAPGSDRFPGRMMSVTDALAAAEETLAEHGRKVQVTVSGDLHTLDPTTNLTLVRAVQEGSSNILRYGARDGSSTLAMHLADKAHLRITNDLPEARESAISNPLSSGHGLRGLRERVSLTGGNFSADARGTRWVMEIWLPLLPSKNHITSGE